jgi:hypothetical protein
MRYEYRPVPKLGLLGSLLVGLLAFGGIFLGVNSHFGRADLVFAAGGGVAVFLFVFLVAQHLVWRADEERISWRWIDCRRRRIRWQDVSGVEVVPGRRSALGAEYLQLRLRDGRSVRVRPSKRSGGLEPEAVTVLEQLAARHGFAVGWQERREPAAAHARKQELPSPALPGQQRLFDDG